MAKTVYTATDANGTVHTRKSDRGYSHTVVFRNVKSEKLADAVHKGWRNLDANNYKYEASIADGSTVLYITPAGSYHASRDAAYIAADQKAQTEKNAERVAKAQAFIAANPDKAAYLDAEELKRIASAEKADYTTWFNAGWCGRFDLAQKLAAKYTDVQILPATTR